MTCTSINRRRRRPLGGRIPALVLTLGLVIGALTVSTPAHGAADLPRPSRDTAIARARAIAGDAAATSTGQMTVRPPTSGGLEALATTNSVTQFDSFGDTPRERGDLRAAGARLTTQSLRLTAELPRTIDPVYDPNWVFGDSNLVWLVDAGADGSVDKVVVLVAIWEGFIAVVFGNTPTPNELCTADATIESGGKIGVLVPSACIGSPKRIAFRVEMASDTDTFAGGVQGPIDRAPDSGLAGTLNNLTVAPGTAGAYVIDQNGAFYKVNVGGAPRALKSRESPVVQNARGVATTPDGGHGYVVDGTGRLHAFGVGRNYLPSYVYGTPSWPSQNIARGVAIRPYGSAGFVLDLYGGLHSFGIGGKRAVPRLYNAPLWPGVDMARGVAVLPNGKGGFVLDAFGGLHWFAIGEPRGAPAVFGAPSFPGSDAARGVSITPDGKGGSWSTRPAPSTGSRSARRARSRQSAAGRRGPAPIARAGCRCCLASSRGPAPRRARS